MLQRVYNLVWGQCTDELKSTLDEYDDFPDVKEKQDPIRLLNKIKGMTFNVKKPHKHPIVAMHAAKYRFYHLKQGNQEPKDYFDSFNNIISAIEASGGHLAEEDIMYEYALKKRNIHPTRASPA